MLPRALKRALAAEVANSILGSIHRNRASTSREDIKPICLAFVTPHPSTAASSPPFPPATHCMKDID